MYLSLSAHHAFIYTPLLRCGYSRLMGHHPLWDRSSKSRSEGEEDHFKGLNPLSPVTTPTAECLRLPLSPHDHLSSPVPPISHARPTVPFPTVSVPLNPIFIFTQKTHFTLFRSLPAAPLSQPLHYRRSQPTAKHFQPAHSSPFSSILFIHSFHQFSSFLSRSVILSYAPLHL
jgi:hypothetical protein